MAGDIDVSPWVSFCMSTYRRPHFLLHTLKELQQQTNPDFEVVISDNDPEGSARPVVESMQDKRFRYFHNAENLGMVKSFNKSIERSRGQFIAMITDDDPVYHEMIEVLAGLYKEYPDYGVYIGGYNTVYNSLLLARISKVRVGVNSGLADNEIGAVKKYSSREFPAAFLGDELGNGLLWSAGIVKREIALQVGGMPDYGTPCLADCGYILLCGTHSGLVYINKALGYRSMHDDNFSYKQSSFDGLAKAPDGFYNWIINKLPAGIMDQETDKAIKNYIGRELTYQTITIKKILMATGHKNDEAFESFKKNLFRISYFKKWLIKYRIAIYFPNLFNLLLSIRNFIFPKKEAK